MTRLSLLILALLFAVGVSGRTASDFFTTAPDRVIRVLPQSTRLDMVDYFNYGSSRASENYFGGEARVKGISDAVITVEIDKDVELQLAVLPAKNDTVIAVSTTLLLPVADSSLKFYDTSWKPLGKAPFQIPTYNEWLTKEGQGHIPEISLHLPFMPVAARFNPEANILLLNNGASEYLSKEQFGKFEPWLIGYMSFDISSARFSPTK